MRARICAISVAVGLFLASCGSDDDAPAAVDATGRPIPAIPARPSLTLAITLGPVLAVIFGAIAGLGTGVWMHEMKQEGTERMYSSERPRKFTDKQCLRYAVLVGSGVAAFVLLMAVLGHMAAVADYNDWKNS